jgi:predicted DCC family thiol-disulfide oxidoreductase YuxK
MPDSNTYILLFDGVCNLCNGTVQFVIKRDVRKRFRFATLQSASGQALLRELGLSAQHFNSVILIHGETYYIKSTAALRVLKELGGFWKLCYALIIIPRPIRDLVYDMVAKTRYRVFGKRDMCMVPEPEVRERFISN